MRMRLSSAAVAAALLTAAAFAPGAGLPARAQATTYCISATDGTGTAPVVTRPDYAGYVVHSLPLGFCGIRITGECMEQWCQISFRGGSGWINMRYVSRA